MVENSTSGSMAVSVKIREDTKRRLERLSAKLEAMTGKDLSFQEIVDALAKAGEADLSIDPAKDPRRKLGLWV